MDILNSGMFLFWLRVEQNLLEHVLKLFFETRIEVIYIIRFTDV